MSTGQDKEVPSMAAIVLSNGGIGGDGQKRDCHHLA